MKNSLYTLVLALAVTASVGSMASREWDPIEHVRQTKKISKVKKAKDGKKHSCAAHCQETGHQGCKHS